MPRGKSHHVVHNPDGGWDVKKSGSKRASLHHEIQRVAIRRGRKISENAGTEFYIHGRNGQIRDKDSHGSDKFPPKG